MILNYYAKTQLMCAFCENLLPEDCKICSTCLDYKGIMTILDFQKIYGEEY